MIYLQESQSTHLGVNMGIKNLFNKNSDADEVAVTKEDSKTVFTDGLNDVISKFSPPKVIKPYVPLYRNVYAFYSPVGGTGVSSFIAHVANTLHTDTTKVCILDLNINFPVVASYFCDVPSEKSIHRAFRVNNPEIGDYVIANNSAPYVCSACYNLAMREYWDTGTRGIEELITKLSSTFTYVLIDLPSEILYEGFLVGVGRCNKVYSLIQSVMLHLQQLLCTSQQLESDDTIYRHPNAIKDVIQTQVTDNYFSSSDLSAYGLNLLGLLPFDAEVKLSFDSTALLKKSAKQQIKHYYGVVDLICEDIKLNTAFKTGGEDNAR